MTNQILIPPPLGGPIDWTLPGIPEETMQDQMRWSQQRKSPGALFKAFFAACRDLDLYKIAKILEYRQTMPAADQFDIHRNKSGYSAAETVFRKDKSIKQFTALRLIYSQAEPEMNDFTDLQIISRLNNQDNWTCADYFVSVGLIPQSVYGRLVTCVTDNYNPPAPKTIPNIYQIIKNSSVYLEYAVKIGSVDDVAAALKRMGPGHEAGLYQRAAEKHPEVFQMLCRVKFESEQNGGAVFDIPLADEWIAKNIRSLKQNEPDETWDKYEDTSIFHNLPYEENGTRLRDLYDFAAQRVERYQQMQNGQMHFQLSIHKYLDYKLLLLVNKNFSLIYLQYNQT